MQEEERLGGKRERIGRGMDEQDGKMEEEESWRKWRERRRGITERGLGDGEGER